MNLPAFVPRKLLFRADEVAALLGVSPRTVRRWMGQGEFGELLQTATGTRITFDGLEAFYAGRADDSHSHPANQ